MLTLAVSWYAQHLSVKTCIRHVSDFLSLVADAKPGILHGG